MSGKLSTVNAHFKMRVAFVLAPLALLAAAGFGGLVAIVPRAPAEVTLEFDVFDFTDQWLEGLEGAEIKPTGEHAVLSDIEVFLLRAMCDDPMRRNAYSRPKGAHASGTPVAISYHWPSVEPLTGRRVARYTATPIQFVVTPTVLRAKQAIELDFTFNPTDCRQSNVCVVVPDASSTLVFLDDVDPEIHRALLISPRIVRRDPSDWSIWRWLAMR
jgi:hypothetical protein